MNSLIGEPFVDDQRLAKAEGELRKRFPNIPETVEFATYTQPKTFYENDDGFTLPLPETAVFVVRVPSPKADHQTKGVIVTERWGELLEQWRMREKAYKHLVGTPDPLVVHFEGLLRSLASKHKNLRTMLN